MNPVAVRLSYAEAEALMSFLSQRSTLWVTEAQSSGVPDPLDLCQRVSKAHAAAIKKQIKKP